MKKESNPIQVTTIDYLKVKLVREKRLTIGFTAKEVSFLLGKRTTFVTVAEDPFSTLKYGVDDTLYLTRIFRCSVAEIHEGIEELPDFIKMIRKVDKKTGSIQYSPAEPKLHADKIELLVTEIEEDSLSVDSKASLDDLISEVKELFENGFFDAPKTALEAYEKCTEKFGYPIKPEYLSLALQKYTLKKSFPRLDSKSKSEGFARTLYQRVDDDKLK
ncbi:hypothetical protein [Algoriphagus sp.]|uniref:hypothetical protein n=1 Tax=Algoriphagus sp. TaxID=1872435 RepID=UPI003F6F448E